MHVPEKVSIETLRKSVEVVDVANGILDGQCDRTRFAKSVMLLHAPKMLYTRIQHAVAKICMSIPYLDRG